MGLTSVATRIINRYGRTATILRRTTTGPAHNPTITEVSHSATVALLNYTSEERAGTLIAETDLKAIVSIEGLAIVPTVSDKLKIDDLDYAVHAVHPIQTNGTAHFYTLRVSI